MALTFFYGSGSPYAWRVSLALEHKQIPYERKLLSFADGDTRKPAFLALNPRGKVPVIVDGGVTLYESAAIVEYLDEAYPDHGKRLFPGAVADRAHIRRMICEVDHYVGPTVTRLFSRVLLTPAEQWNAERIARVRDELAAELERWAVGIRSAWLAGELSAADFTLYPQIALALRCEKRKPDLALRARLPARIEAWMRAVEMLPFFPRTLPPHWA